MWQKVISLETNLENLTGLSGELQLWILESGSQMTSSYYYRTLTLKNPRFSSLHWVEILHHNFHRQIFSHSYVLLLKLLVVCSIYHCCAALTEHIAVRRCLLLSISVLVFVSTETSIASIMARFSPSISSYMSLTFSVSEGVSFFVWISN